MNMFLLLSRLAPSPDPGRTRAPQRNQYPSDTHIVSIDWIVTCTTDWLAILPIATTVGGCAAREDMKARTQLKYSTL